MTCSKILTVRTRRPAIPTSPFEIHTSRTLTVADGQVCHTSGIMDGNVTRSQAGHQPAAGSLYNRLRLERRGNAHPKMLLHMSLLVLRGHRARSGRANGSRA